MYAKALSPHENNKSGQSGEKKAVNPCLQRITHEASKMAGNSRCQTRQGRQSGVQQGEILATKVYPTVPRPIQTVD